MNKQRLQELAGIQVNELGIDKPIFIIPNKTWVLKSEQYKSFYQLITVCEHWGVDWNDDYTVYFGEDWNDFYFFTFLYSTSLIDNIKPDRYIVTYDNICESLNNYSETNDYYYYVIENDKEYKDGALEAIPYVKQILEKLEEHSL